MVQVPNVCSPSKNPNLQVLPSSRLVPSAQLLVTLDPYGRLLFSTILRLWGGQAAKRRSEELVILVPYGPDMMTP